MDLLEKIERGASELVSRVEERPDAPKDTVIVLTRGWWDEDEVITYYLASMSKQAVFWLDKVEHHIVTDNARAIVSKQHLGMCN